ncbi:hypothetical protein C0431_12680 [bacterium]|nr:hypothetical protein [bacterium]
MRYHTRIEGERYPVSTLLTIRPDDVELVLSESFIDQSGVPRSMIACRAIRQMDFSMDEQQLLVQGEAIDERVILIKGVAEAPEFTDALRAYLGLAERGDGTIPLFAKKG